MSYTVINGGADIVPTASASLDPDYEAIITPDVESWFDAYASGLTLVSGVVSNVANQKPGGAALTQGAVGSRPAIEAAKLDGRDAFIFTRGVGVLPKRLLNTFPAGASLSWTKVMVVWDSEGATTGDQGALWGGGGNGAGAHRVHRNSGNIIHRCGGATNEALVQVAIDWTVPHLIMADWDHTTGTAGLSIDGLSWTTTTNALASVTQTACAIGAEPTTSSGLGWNGWGFEYLIYPVSLRLSANATKLAWAKQLIHDDFPSLTIA